MLIIYNTQTKVRKKRMYKFEAKIEKHFSEENPTSKENGLFMK